MRRWLRSLSSFSWALPVFGIDQALKLAAQPVAGVGHPVLAALDDVASAAGGQLAGPCREVFAAGDELQRRLVDLMFEALPLPVRPPGGGDFEGWGPMPPLR